MPMFETMTSFVLGRPFRRARPTGLRWTRGGYPRLMSRYRRPYETADGHMCVLIYTDKQWQSFFAAIGRPGPRGRSPLREHQGAPAQHRRGLRRGRPHLPDPTERGVARAARGGGHPEHAHAHARDHPGRPPPQGGRASSSRSSTRSKARSRPCACRRAGREPSRGRAARHPASASTPATSWPRRADGGRDRRAGCDAAAAAIAATRRANRTRRRSDGFRAQPRPGGHPGGRGLHLRRLRRRVLAEAGQGRRLPDRLLRCDGEGRLARHLRSRGLWRIGPRHDRGGHHDAHDRGIRGRHVRRIRHPHQRLRPEPRRRLRDRGAEAAHAAADGRKDGRRPASPSRSRIRGSTRRS